MERHTIGGLRQKLVEATSFYDIQDYFLTLVETNFQALDGKKGKNKTLQSIIANTIVAVCEKQGWEQDDDKIVLVNFMMIEVRPRFFWHGTGLVNGKHLFTFIYFSDLDKGLVTVTNGSNNCFARISAQSAGIKNPMEEFSDN